MDFYVQRGIQIAVLWILRYICHGLSTSTSHGATFGLIGNARKQLLKKLNTMPLGAVQTRSFIYMMSIDWRVGLWQLICIPFGFAAFAIMMSSTPK